MRAAVLVSPRHTLDRTALTVTSTYEKYFALFLSVSLTIYGNSSVRKGFGSRLREICAVCQRVSRRWRMRERENGTRRCTVGWLKPFLSAAFSASCESVCRLKKRWKFSLLWNLAQVQTRWRGAYGYGWLFRNAIVESLLGAPLSSVASFQCRCRPLFPSPCIIKCRSASCATSSPLAHAAKHSRNELNRKRHTELEPKQYCALPIAINHAVWEPIWLEPLSSHCPPKSSIDAVSRPKSRVLAKPRHRRNVMIASTFAIVRPASRYFHLWTWHWNAAT